MKVSISREYEPGDGVTCRVQVDPLPDAGRRLTIIQPNHTAIINLDCEQAFQLADLLTPKERIAR